MVANKISEDFKEVDYFSKVNGLGVFRKFMGRSSNPGKKSVPDDITITEGEVFQQD